MEKAKERMGQLQRNRRSEVRAKVMDVIKNEGFTFDELFGNARGKTASGKPKTIVKPKYCNPADSTQTWTGRGKRPRWFQAALTGGKQESDLLIK